MSTDLRIVNMDVSMDELFDGRLKQFGIAEHLWDESIPHRRTLTDGRNWLLVLGPASDGDSAGVWFKTWGLNNPHRILAAIEKVFEARIFTEHEPQYWGFDTTEEWDAAMRVFEKADADRFYVDVMKYVNNQPNGIRAGSNGETMAKIAKGLIEQRPGLALPNAKEELLGAIDTIWERDHAITVQIDEGTMALAKLAFANDEDLPQC